MQRDQRDLTGPDLAQWIRERRLEAMLTQEQLAERAGISVRTVRNLEAGQRVAPRMQTKRLVLAALGRAVGIDGRGPMPAQLPADPPDFVGREPVLRRLDETYRSRAEQPGGGPMLVVLAGRCGAGKTAAAVHWSRRHRQLFIDGQLFINLHGSSERTRPTQPLDGLRLILGSLGVTEGQIPRNVDAAVCLYRTLVADRHILVLLDDARDAAQIRPLLPGGAGSAVLITGRNNLSDLLTREGAVHVDIGGLDRAPARAILVAALGRQRVDAESAAADEIARQCGNLPLVLKLAANELLTKPRRTLTGFAAAMRRNGTAEILNASRNVAELQAALGAV